MAIIPNYTFDNTIVALRKAHGIVVCAMEAAGSKVIDRSEQIDYALWEASVLLEDAIFQFEDEVSWETTGNLPKIECIKEQIAQIVERFADCPVVIPANGSLLTEIAEAIRNAEIK